jgi:hypothetical protein
MHATLFDGAFGLAYHTGGIQHTCLILPIKEFFQEKYEPE